MRGQLFEEIRENRKWEKVGDSSVIVYPYLWKRLKNNNDDDDYDDDDTTVFEFNCPKITVRAE